MSTPFSITEPFPQFHGRDGQPLEAGQIFIGSVSMDPIANPVQVYWDAALTIPASQPIRTQAGFPWNNGAASNFYVDAENYSIKILDRQNALVFSSPSVGERFPAWLLSGGVTAQIVQYQSQWYGSQLTTAYNKFQWDVASVFDFMTSAQRQDVTSYTGLIDCTDAINNAINANTTLGRDVYFPPGKYRVSSAGIPAIAVTKDGVSLRGAGRGATIISNVGSDSAIGVLGNPVTYLEGVRISDMTIEGTGASKHGLEVSYANHSTFERIESKSNGKDGIRTKFVRALSFLDCHVHDNTENGIVLGDTSGNVTVRGGDVYANTLEGIVVSLDGGAGRPYGNTFYGTICAINGAGVGVYSADTTSFVSCWFYQAGGSQVVVSRDSVAGNSSRTVFEACNWEGTALLDFAANYADDTTLSNCSANVVNVMANANRTRLVNTIVGTFADLGTNTVRLGLDSGLVSISTPQVSNAFRFRTLVAGGTYPILEMHNWRLWIDDSTKILRIKSTDPTAPGDGEPVNLYSGMPTVYTLGTVGAPGSLPAANTMKGQVARINDGVAALAWGAIINAPVFAESTPYLIWSNGTNWTVVGK